MSKKLAAYFSATGITARVAENLADSVGADFLLLYLQQVTQKKTWIGWTKVPEAAWK